MKRIVFRVLAPVACLGLMLALAACGAGAKQVYRLELAGAVKSPGVIDYAGLEMNVYKDEASNPCGDCADQPVSVYVGADAEEVAAALAAAITRADDIWQVKELAGGTLVLEEKDAGSAGDILAPAAPDGLSITGYLGDGA